jgi:hypothetical protein
MLREPLMAINLLKKSTPKIMEEVAASTNLSQKLTKISLYQSKFKIIRMMRNRHKKMQKNHFKIIRLKIRLP